MLRRLKKSIATVDVCAELMLDAAGRRRRESGITTFALRTVNDAGARRRVGGSGTLNTAEVRHNIHRCAVHSGIEHVATSSVNNVTPAY